MAVVKVRLFFFSFLMGFVVILDGETVRNFALDAEALRRAVDSEFEQLDVNKDGVLSRSELRVALERLNLLERDGGFPVKKSLEELDALYESAFEMFDVRHDGKVDIDEFREQLKQILLAVAAGLGAAPVQILIDEGSLLRALAEQSESNFEFL